MGAGRKLAICWKRLKIESSFVNGLRVTDAATISVVEMVLAGAINKSLVAAVNMAGGRAGLSGKDGHLITASKLCSGSAHSDSQIEKVDLGFVGASRKRSIQKLSLP